MVGHRPWSEIKRKKHMQNGSRLGEHRKPRVSPESWWLAGIIVVALLALVQWQAEAQEYKPFTMGTGLIVQHAEMCFSPDLSSDSINLLNQWQLAVDQLESYERGGSEPDVELAYQAQALYDNHMCSTVAAFYHIEIVMATEGYVLARFDEQHGFNEGTFIVAKRDVLPDRRL